MGSGCIDPRFLDLGASWRWVVSFIPRPLYSRIEPPVPIGQEAGWAPEPIWTTWRSENFCPHRDSNSDPSVVQPVPSRHTDCAIPALILYGVYCIMVPKFSAIPPLIYPSFRDHPYKSHSRTEWSVSSWENFTVCYCIKMVLSGRGYECVHWVKRPENKSLSRLLLTLSCFHYTRNILISRLNNEY
jgi:hypothetical protein